MGDWNGVVGQGIDGEEVGEFGLGNRNERGQKLVDFCKRNNLCITNTIFQHHKRRRYNEFNIVRRDFVESHYANESKHFVLNIERRGIAEECD